MPRHGKRSDRLLQRLAEYESVLVVTHDTPDPDAIASGWAIWSLLRHRLHERVRLIGGGEIVRAENQHMVKLLRPPLELVDRIEVEGRTAAVLVDCNASRGLEVRTNRSVDLVAVIDHHQAASPNSPSHDAPRPLAGEESLPHGSPRPLAGEGLGVRAKDDETASPPALARLPFHDIRPHVAASASIAAGYLREQSLTPSVRLATALLYAIRTETAGSATYYSPLDRSILFWLTRFGNPGWLAEIENAPLKQAYFTDLTLAMQSTMVYGDTALCLLPRAAGPETVGEVADLLIRGESIHRVLCGAVCEGDLVLSVRTERGGEDASRLIRRTVDGLGQAGGHAQRAGGKIHGRAPDVRSIAALQDEVRQRWLAVCRVENQPPRPLISRDEILQNL